ncbi:MAG: oligoendopeptidase F [Bdellovibrionales bacterium]|nr:oligoendopeptidase F [Bdellovibrionales bacterium]
MSEASSLPDRSEVNELDTWDLTPLFANTALWETEFRVAEARLEKLAAFEGQLSSSSQTFFDALEEIFSQRRNLEKLYVYAHLLSDTDTTNDTSRVLLSRAQNLYARYAAASSYLIPEILSLESERLESFLKDSKFNPYRRSIDEVLRYRAHTLSKSEEKIIALGSEVFSSFRDIFGQLNNADLDFGVLELDGNRVPLTHSSLLTFLRNRNRSIREKAFMQYYSRYEATQHSLSAIYAGSIKRDVYLARIRSHPSALEAALYSDNIPPTVYESLVQAVRNNIDSHYDYLALRKEILGLERLELFDTYVPLGSEISMEHTYEESCSVLREALKPLGEEYVEVLYSGLTEKRWVDRFENKGKRSGAYSSGCFDSPPYILMNYKKSEIRDLYTLAHEAGHSMHSLFSRRHQPYPDSSYTIFVAEVASTCNEILLTDYLLKQHKDNSSLVAYLINQELDNLRGTLFSQVLYAEFEKIVHERAEKNEALSLNFFKEAYSELLRFYYGETTNIPDIAGLGGLRIPHFYSNFYVYKYATGISAAIALGEQILSGDGLALERYLRFLHAGSTKYSIELLQDAGVDLLRPQPVIAAIERFRRLTSQLRDITRSASL